MKERKSPRTCTAGRRFSCAVIPNVLNFISHLSSSWDRWLRSREASRRLQLQVPVLPQTFGETGTQDCRHTQDGADVRVKIWTCSLPFIFATPTLLKCFLQKPVDNRMLLGIKVSSLSLNKFLGTQQRMNDIDIFWFVEATALCCPLVVALFFTKSQDKRCSFYSSDC